MVGSWPSSLNRRVLKLRRFFEPLRRAFLAELVGEPETLVVGSSTLLSVLHPRQTKQSAGFEGAALVRWGSFSVYGVKLHLLCSTNRVPTSYELTPASTAEVRLTRELLDGAGLGDGVARRLLGDLAYRSGPLEEAPAEAGVMLVTERAEQRGARQQVGKSPSRASSASSGLRRRWRDWPRGSRRS